jgi:transposase-like protein
MSVADFARQHGIHYTTLYAWRRQRDQVKASPAFVQVELASPAPPTELLIEIGAVRLRLGTEAQLALAARLLQMLQGGPRC